VPSFSEIERIDGGWRGTKRTIDKMHHLVEQGKLDPTLHKLATWLRRGLHQNDFDGHRQVLWKFLVRCGLFQRDPFQIERIEHPLAAMQPVLEGRLAGLNDWHKPATLFVGDCDLYGVMANTIGGLWGFPYAFKTVKADKGRPDEFSHVYPLVLWPDQGFVAMDATVDESDIGWEPPIPAARAKLWPEPRIEDTGVSGLNGQGGSGLGFDFTYESSPEGGAMDVNFNRTRPVRLEDISRAGLAPDLVMPNGHPAAPAAAATLQSKAQDVVSRAMEKVRQRQVFPNDFELSAPMYRRGDPVLPRACADIPVRATPELPATPGDGGFTDCPPTLPEAWMRIPPDSRIRPKPVYHLPEPGISQHEFLSPTFPFARQVTMVEPNTVKPLPDAGGAMNGMGALGQDIMTGAATVGSAAGAAAGATSVWDSIAGIAGNLITAAGGVMSAKITADMQKRVLEAQQRVMAGGTVAAPGAPVPAVYLEPFYTKPYFLVPAAVVGLYAGYKVAQTFMARPRRRR
jgi:hypothetical protein